MLRTWTYPRKRKGGRPRLSLEVVSLIVRFSKENPSWDYGKIQGELLKLGYLVSVSAVRDVLKRHHTQPAPISGRATSWRHLMVHSEEQILACDFYVIREIFLPICSTFAVRPVSLLSAIVGVHRFRHLLDGSNQFVHLLGYLVLHGWQHVGIGIHRYVDLRVPQPLLDDLRVDPFLEH